jgi:hypothetical protein
MIFQHSRFQIWNSSQHPYRHSLDDFAYSNPSLPGVSTVQSAIDYMVAVLYPQSQAAVATVGALPAGGNTINDFRVVQDDGDGKAAGYRWEQREGEAVASWHKIYDLDWGTDSILQGFLGKTQDIYIKQWGYDDLDVSGAAVTGLFAGQSIYGGATANTNLTLLANSGDGVGAGTGFVQVGDNFRPTVTSAYSSGTTSERWLKIWSDTAGIGTMAVAGGSITDSSGAISFDNENLTTTGTLTTGTLLLGSASITDSSGTISFDNENLTTTGTLTAGNVSALGSASSFLSGTTFGTLVLGSGSITDTSGGISFDNENLVTTGNVTGAALTGSTVNGGNLRLTGNILSSLDTDGNIALTPDGTGIVNVTKALTTVGITATGTVGVTGDVTVDNLRLDGNTISSTDVNGTIDLSPNGTGDVTTSGQFRPTTNGTLDLGAASARWSTAHISTGISDGTTVMGSSTLQSLRNATGTVTGQSLFWNNGTGLWEVSAPDTEIDHGSISGLGDDDHLQYALLAGRAGGQSLIGGTVASNNLDLESTSNVTKGFVQTKDSFRAFTDASYSGGWSGADLGGASNRFRHFYSAGEFFGLRLENVGALPSPSTQNIGRLVYLTTTKDVYVDIGTSLKKIDQDKFLSDTSWNGTDTTKDVDVSSEISDARRAIWALHDNTNDYDRIYCSIKATSATNVRITVGTALPAGSYRLIGIE